jgi:hypothetical protein
MFTESNSWVGSRGVRLVGVCQASLNHHCDPRSQKFNDRTDLRRRPRYLWKHCVQVHVHWWHFIVFQQTHQCAISNRFSSGKISAQRHTQSRNRRRNQARA